MKIDLIIKRIKKICFFSSIFLLVILFQSNSQIINSMPMETYQEGLIVEELRLRVPSKYKEVWLKAEKSIWEPWLSIQDGFLGRKIFWDKEKEEALILVDWQNKKLWKNISIDEVNEVQEKFEQNDKASLNINKNPFELIYEGELDKQE